MNVRAARMYIGTYTDEPTPQGERSQGIYAFEMDLNTGKLSLIGAAPYAENPSYLTLSHNGRFLYAVGEAAGHASVSAYAIGPDGLLRKMGTGQYPGSAMCHLDISGDDRYLVASNYLSGTVLSIALQGNGALGGWVSQMHHAGSGPDTARQAGPHAHSAQFSKDGRRVLAADLGADALYAYTFDPATGRLSGLGQTKLTPGEGPRHFVWNGEDVYVVTELGNHVQHLVPGRLPGLYALRQSVSVLPRDFIGESDGADIHLSPDGRFVYASSRGSDAIFVAERRPEGLRPVGTFPCGGKTPRGFALSPGGEFVVVANQGTHGLTVLARDAQSGRLSQAVQGAQVPHPVCVRFALPQVGGKGPVSV